MVQLPGHHSPYFSYTLCSLPLIIRRHLLVAGVRLIGCWGSSTVVFWSPTSVIRHQVVNHGPSYLFQMFISVRFLSFRGLRCRHWGVTLVKSVTVFIIMMNQSDKAHLRSHLDHIFVISTRWVLDKKESPSFPLVSRLIPLILVPSLLPPSSYHSDSRNQDSVVLTHGMNQRRSSGMFHSDFRLSFWE